MDARPRAALVVARRGARPEAGCPFLPTTRSLACSLAYSHQALGWLPGPLFWEEPPPREGDEEEPPATLPEGSVARREVAVVYFLGGCTYSEVSALRWLGQQLRPPVDFVVASTHMTSGDQIIESLMQTFENSLSSLE